MEIQKWEYKVVSNEHQLKDFHYEHMLNEAGKDGWELVSASESVWIEPHEGMSPDTARRSIMHFYFKRPAQLPSDIVFTSDLKKTTEDNIPGGSA